MLSPKNISILDFTYQLPDNRIALFPLEQRDQSKLLLYHQGSISEDVFSNIAKYTPEDHLLVFNDSKVINARIVFEKSTGSKIEIFCLEPAELINDYATVMNKRGEVRWKCMIGGLSKWKEPYLEKQLFFNEETFTLRASIQEAINEVKIVLLEWDHPKLTFAEVLSTAGDVPLPPYIKRKTNVKDKDRYQTIYAKEEGSVAAPTAGLHFTEAVFISLEKKNIGKAYVSLHVGAGTFKPVKAETMEGHEMHAEWIDVSKNMIEQLIEFQDRVIVTGTTSLRTIESLYWIGIKAMLNPESEKLEIHQWDAYDQKLNAPEFTVQSALLALLKWMERQNRKNIFTQTQLLIAPGYRFRIAKALITNFHQPQSTLLLLVAAAIGDDWKRCYEYALKNEFRFLSYGDSSLIFFRDDLI